MKTLEHSYTNMMLKAGIAVTRFGNIQHNYIYIHIEIKKQYNFSESFNNFNKTQGNILPSTQSSKTHQKKGLPFKLYLPTT
jgi:hypothetical protein